ncbi:MAG TPA: tetratricopeptide repeat protein [Nitrospira sp.]|nr:tetratricopeptide repeat protein [Nitrospira sp.]
MKNGLIVLVLIMAGMAAACGGPEERKASYRIKAQEYIAAGNYPKARVALRNVLKIDPKDAEAFYLFAKVEEKEKNWRNAVKLYQDVVELAPDHTGALITLAKYYLEARLTEHVVSTADKVLAKHPHQPQAMALKIAASATTDEMVPEAVGKAESLAAQFPTEPDVAVLLATLYAQQQRYREAEAVLRRAVDAHPRDMDLLNNLNNVFMQAKDMAGAEAVVRRMIDVEPKQFEHRIRLARLFDARGDYVTAESLLREAVALDQDSEERHLLLAEFLSARKNVQAAERVLLDAVDRLPHATKIQFGLAALYGRSGQAAKARERYAALIREYKDKPAGLEAKIKVAEMDLAEGKQAEAEREVEEVLKDNPRSSEGLILSGKMALSRRNGKQAVQAFRTVLHDQPELATVQFLLGQAYLLTGEYTLARESFERAVALYPGQVDARRSLAALETQSGRPGQARARLEDLLKQRPDDVAALDMLMNLDLMTKDWAAADKTLSRLRAASGDSSTVRLAEGRLYEAQGQTERAVAAYERATTLAPNDPEPLLSLVRLEIAHGRSARAMSRLETMLSADASHLYGHALLGEILAMTGQQEEATAHFRDATRVNPQWITPWIDWAGLHLTRKEPDLAIQVIRSGLAVIPESEELQMLLASAYSEQGRTDSAMAAYEAALRLNPRNLLAANNLAVLLVEYKGDQSSLQKAFALSRDFEKDAPHALFLDTLAWVRFKMGQQEEALRLLKHAIAKSPDLGVVNYHLGMAYYRSGRPGEARSYLTKALQKPEGFPGRQEAEQVLSQIRG